MTVKTNSTVSMSQLILDHLALLLFVSSKLEVLASLDWFLHILLALHALKLENNLFCSFGLLPENRFRLTTESTLLTIVTTLSLSQNRVLSFLVLGHLETLVNFALRAKSFPGLRDVHHDDLKKLTRLPTIALGIEKCPIVTKQYPK